jgi:hypothetical protein
MQYYFAERVKNPLTVLLPFLLPYTLTPGDARYGRNNSSVNNAILEMVKERRKNGPSKIEE